MATPAAAADSSDPGSLQLALRADLQLALRAELPLETDAAGGVRGWPSRAPFPVRLRRVNHSVSWGLAFSSEPPDDALATRHVCVFDCVLPSSPLGVHNTWALAAYPERQVRSGDVLAWAGEIGAPPAVPPGQLRLEQLQALLTNTLELGFMVQRLPGPEQLPPWMEMAQVADAAASNRIPLDIEVPRPAGSFVVELRRDDRSVRWGIRIQSDPPYNDAATHHCFSGLDQLREDSPLGIYNGMAAETRPADQVRDGDVLTSAAAPGAALGVVQKDQLRASLREELVLCLLVQRTPGWQRLVLP